MNAPFTPERAISRIGIRVASSQAATVKVPASMPVIYKHTVQDNGHRRFDLMALINLVDRQVVEQSGRCPSLSRVRRAFGALFFTAATADHWSLRAS